MECLIAFNMADAVKWLITLSGNFPLVFKVNFANFTAQTEEGEFQRKKAENIVIIFLDSTIHNFVQILVLSDGRSPH